MLVTQSGVVAGCVGGWVKRRRGQFKVQIFQEHIPENKFKYPITETRGTCRIFKE